MSPLIWHSRLGILASLKVVFWLLFLLASNMFQLTLTTPYFLRRLIFSPCFLLCFSLYLKNLLKTMFLQTFLFWNILSSLIISVSGSKLMPLPFPFYYEWQAISLGNLRNYPFISQTVLFHQHTSTEALWCFRMDMCHTYKYRFFSKCTFLESKGLYLIRSFYFLIPIASASGLLQRIVQDVPYTRLHPWRVGSDGDQSPRGVAFFLFCWCSEILSTLHKIGTCVINSRPYMQVLLVSWSVLTVVYKCLFIMSSYLFSLCHFLSATSF